MVEHMTHAVDFKQKVIQEPLDLGSSNTKLCKIGVV